MTLDEKRAGMPSSSFLFACGAEESARSNGLGTDKRQKTDIFVRPPAYWIAYGPYGARTPNDPAMKWKVLLWSGAFAGLAVAGWAYWTAAVIPELRTHAPEWKEEEERRAIENKQNPFTGVYSEVRKREDK
ncbi:hypothetical protein HKX48_000790 [Thoreauomyces humboldtii]|nr:hypothetical protein HKX48_000790 [Thoreauomyces humboldtii]